MKTKTYALPIAKKDSESERLKMRFQYGPEKHRDTVLSHKIAVRFKETPAPIALIDPDNPDPALLKIFRGHFPEILNKPGLETKNSPCWGGDVWLTKISNRWYLNWANAQFITSEYSSRLRNHARCVSIGITRARAFYFLSLLLMPAEFRREVDDIFRREERERTKEKRSPKPAR